MVPTSDFAAVCSLIGFIFRPSYRPFLHHYEACFRKLLNFHLQHLFLRITNMAVEADSLKGTWVPVCPTKNQQPLGHSAIWIDHRYANNVDVVLEDVFPIVVHPAVGSQGVTGKARVNRVGG